MKRSKRDYRWPRRDVYPQERSFGFVSMEHGESMHTHTKSCRLNFEIIDEVSRSAVVSIIVLFILFSGCYDAL